VSWRSYFWPCAFFFLLGISIGLASGVVAYRHRAALLRLPGRMATSVARLAKPSPLASSPSPTADRDGSLTIASFESDEDLKLFGDSDVTLGRTTEHATHGIHSLKATFPDGGGALSTWRTLPRNWVGYDRLRFDVYSAESEVPLSLYIKDSKHTSYGERYNEENIRLQPGWNAIDIPLLDVARRINLRDIVQFRLFLWKVPGQHVLYFDNFRLERGRPTAGEPSRAQPPARTASNPTGPPVPTPQASKPSKARVWVVGDSYKIQPDKGTPFNPYVKRDLRRHNGVWDGARRTVTLHGARNEYVGFQVIIEAGDRPLQGVTVLPTDLSGPSTIPRSQMHLFREHYIRVTKPSGWPQPSTGPGVYPDPLIPLDLPTAGGPFEVPARRNQAIWMDIYIPESAAAGLHAGSVTVIGKGMEPVHLTIQLQVWDFILPRQSHLTFWTNYYDLPRGFNVVKDSPEHRAVEQDLWRLSRRHRITALLRHAPSRPNYTGSGSNLKVDWTTFDRRVGPYLDGSVFNDGARPNLFLLPITYAEGKQWPPGDDETFHQMCREFASHFDAKGWDLRKTFIFLGDEPGTKEYPTIKRLARLVRQADSRFRTTVGFSKFSAEVLKEFDGLIDFWTVAGDAYSTTLLTPKKAAGNLIGFYQQGEPYQGNETLDADGLAFRTWPWIAWKYGVDVIYLYSMTEWRLWREGQNPWVNPLNWGKSNSQGILIYPGRHINTRRVIGSIRMKQIRRGMQDYEYFWLAKAAGADPSPVVNAIIRRALDKTNRGWGSPGDWERDPTRWLEARKKLAALILQGQGPRPKVATTARPALPPPRTHVIQEPSRFLLKADFERGALEGWTGGEVQQDVVHKGHYALRATPTNGARYQALELWRKFSTTSQTVLKFALYAKGADWVKVQCWSRDGRRNFARIYNRPPESQWREVTLNLKDLRDRRGGSPAGDTINSIHFAVPNGPGVVLVVDDVALIEEPVNAR